MADKDQALECAYLVGAGYEIIQLTLSRPRFYLHSSTLRRDRLLQHQIKKWLYSTDGRYPVPTAARKNHIDHSLEIGPMQRADGFSNNIDKRLARLIGFENYRFNNPIDTPQEVFLTIDCAYCAAIACDLSKPRAQRFRPEGHIVDGVGIAPLANTLAHSFAVPLAR